MANMFVVSTQEILREMQKLDNQPTTYAKNPWQYAAEVRARNPHMIVKRLETPLENDHAHHAITLRVNSTD